jgi:AcrR family transcriptional regulator
VPTAITPEQREQDREALLDAAEQLMYADGIQAVGMDRLRSGSGLSLKRIYALYPSKEEIAVAMLRRRDRRWRESLSAYVDWRTDPRERVLAVFAWLQIWFSEPDFRGCAWINAYGELGSSSAAVLAEVRAHKAAFHDQLAAWVGQVQPAAIEGIYLLAEGAMVTAAINGNTSAAAVGWDAAGALLDRR